MVRYADLMTLAGGAVAGIALVFAATGNYFLATKFLIAAFIADVLDGWIARNIDAKHGQGSSKQGQMLDRSLDRVTQIVVPLVILASMLEEKGSRILLILLAIYAAIIIPAAFYRLVYRVRAQLDYFPGTPLFVHAGLVIGAVYSGEMPSPRLLILLLLAAIGTSTAIPYMRRIPGRGQRSPSPALLPRLFLLIVFLLVPKDTIFAHILGKLLFSLVTLYLGLGWIPPFLQYKASWKPYSTSN